MYQIPEQLNDAGKAGIETLASLASTTFGGMEQMAALNLSAARSLLEQSAATSRALLAAGDIDTLRSMQESLVKPDPDKVFDYSRRVYTIANQTREALSKVVESQVSELNANLGTKLDQAVKTAPAGTDLAINALRSALSAANTAYDTMSKVAKQANEIAEANLAAVAKFAVTQSKKAA
jgi:phasin family protein